MASSTRTQRGRAARQIAFSLVAMLAVLVLLEGALNWARALGALLGETHSMEEARHTEYDADLGWRNLADFHHPSFYGPERALTTNSQHLRSADGDYSDAKPEGRYRIVVLGDSFTLGFGVDDRETYTAQLEQIVPASQTINMGMGGYGIGQDYLWYQRDGVRFEADLLVFAFIYHDFDRIGMTQFLGYQKPVVALDAGRPVATGVPVARGINRVELRMRADRFTKKLAITSALRRFLPPMLEEVEHDPTPLDAFRVTAEGIFSELARVSQARRQDFALVLLPTNIASTPHDEARKQWLHEFSARSTIAFVDLASPVEDMVGAERDALFIPGDGHLSQAGNRWTAEALAAALAERFPRFPRPVNAPAAATAHDETP